MFTGIIETTAKVTQQTDSKLILGRPENFTKLTIGQSISVNGACLSIVCFDKIQIEFDVVPETFTKTNLRNSQTVNLERAMLANGRFEGHVVLGHVDTTTKLIQRTEEKSGERFTFFTPAEIQPYIVEKGSLTLNGISLTIMSVTKHNFDVAVIPHTLLQTNFEFLRVGEKVNIEADYFAKLLKKWQ